jgi:oligopeptidase B
MRLGLTFLLAILLIPVVLGGLGCRRSGQPSEEELTPPVAKVVPETLEMHGHTWVDDYTWMKDVPRTSPETIAYVEAENAYTDAVMHHTEKFQEKLFKEMKARIKETDLEVPVRIDDYYYYSRTEEGQNYRIYCRKKGSEDAPEQIILDVNELAEGFEFYQVGRLSRSPDHRILAFPADTTGAEKYIIRFKNLDTGEFLTDELYPVRGVTWAEDNRTLFYTRPVDPDIETPYQCYRHILGTSQDEDVMLLQEDDLAWGLGVGKSRSKKFIFLYAGDNETSEIRYLPADKPMGEFRLFAPRKTEVEYNLVHWQDRFFIVTNEDDAKNNKILWTPVDRPARANWKEYIGHREDVYVTGFDEFEKYVAIHERKDGLETIRVIDMLTNQTSYVTLDPTRTTTRRSIGSPTCRWSRRARSTTSISPRRR